MYKLSIKKKKKKKIGLVNAGERPAEDRRNALYMRAQQNSAAARLTMHFGVAAGLTAVIYSQWRSEFCDPAHPGTRCSRDQSHDCLL